MSLALLAVIAAAVCSGSAAVLQAIAVRRLPTASSVSAGFVVRLARSPFYLLALALVACGFVLSFAALRTLPLFVVQAGRASSLAVTAVLSVLILRARLRAVEVVAVLGVGAGLVVLAISAGPQQPAAGGVASGFWMLAAVVAIALTAAGVLRIGPDRRSGFGLAVLAGSCFAVLALGARLLPGFAAGELIVDPTAWAMAAAGASGLLLGALALQRASVVAVTAAMVATETVLGSLLGMIFCADRPAAGMTVAAVGGFVLVLAGALTLARFGAPEPRGGHEEPAALPIG